MPYSPPGLRRTFLLAAVAWLAAGLAAAQPPSRLILKTPAEPLHPGEAGEIRLILANAAGKPRPAKRDLTVDLSGAKGLVSASRQVIPAGKAESRISIRPTKPGLWEIEARSRGLESAQGVVVCVARKRGALGLGAPAGPRRAVWGPDRPGAGSVALAGWALAQQGGEARARLVAQPVTIRRGRDGWVESRIDAYCFVGENPAACPRELQINLVMEESTGALALSPPVLTIPPGEVKSRSAATLSARQAATAQVRALYAGGVSEPIEISFLRAEPRQLGLMDIPEKTIRGLGLLSSEVYVRLLDEGGEPALADRPVPVTLVVSGPAGSHSYPVTVPEGEFQRAVSVEIARHGEYELGAFAPGLKPAPDQPLHFGIDWSLLAFALFGGVLGSLARVIWRREASWGWGAARVLFLGMLAAVLVLLLSVFGLLSLLEGALPQGWSDKLQEVPVTSLFAVLLLGFLAGLLFDKVFGRFLGADGGGSGGPGRPAREGERRRGRTEVSEAPVSG
jgi:hypothetical protein